MKIAAWNVNSVRARLERLVDWLKSAQPDVLCLQELKCMDAEFPMEAVREAGYHAAVHGQKTYNGVAILAKMEPTDVVRGLSDGVDDSHARLIAATVNGVRVVSAYAPNGQEVGSPAYEYKLQWYGRLRWISPSHPLLSSITPNRSNRAICIICCSILRPATSTLTTQNH